MTDNKEQTAVQLIIQALDIECKSRGMNVNWDMYLEMEKERIISAQMDMFHFLNNLKFGMMYIEKREEAEKFAEQYYNETYVGNK